MALTQEQANHFEIVVVPIMDKLLCENADYQAALAAGEMTPAAQAAIERAMMEAMERGSELHSRFMKNTASQDCVTRFQFERARLAALAAQD